MLPNGVAATLRNLATMSKIFYFPGNFKLWIIVSMALMLLVVTIAGVLFLRENIIHGAMEQVYSEIRIKNSLVSRIIENLIRDTNRKIQKISQGYTVEKQVVRDTNKTLRYIESQWLKVSGDSINYRLAYYDNKGGYYNISDKDNPFDLSSVLQISEISGNFNYTDGRSFFRCREYCQLYFIKPLSNHNFHSGFIQVSISIDSILDQILENIYGVRIIVFRKGDATGSKKICLHGEYFLYEQATISFTYRGFMSDFPFFSCHQEDWSAEKVAFSGSKKLASYFQKEGLLFVILGDASVLLKKSDAAIYGLIEKSLLIYLALMMIFYMMLKLAMKRIHVLGAILDSIARKEFTFAKSRLAIFSRCTRHDEIDDIYHHVSHLADELERAMREIGVKNRQLTEKVHETQQLADNDALTGLFNRRRFTLELNTLIGKREPFTLVSADLNHFKLVNDSLGHAAGDNLLIDFSGILASVFRGKGIVGRMGGDEFSIIVQDADPAGVAMHLTEVAERTGRIFQDNSLGIHVSTSIGAARFPHDAADLDELSSFADIAMYENKRLKASAYHFYNGAETILQEEREAKFWDDLLETGFRKMLYVVYLQPIVHADSHLNFAYEALTRIKKDDEIYTPEGFIDYAERNRKIVVIDKYVLKKSMSMGARLDYPVLNINLSYATLSNPDLMRYVFDCSVTTRYPLQNIIIEITETAEIRNINITREFIKNMKHYGLRFALDDFGTGFSSFSYLAKLGVDYIKLDKSLIRELLVNSSSHHIVRSLIELCKNLGIKTIAEGVENHEILLEASRYDFDFMQGYYFSRPRPISEFPDAAQGLAEVELQRLIQL